MSISFETLALAKRYTNSAVAYAIGGVAKIDFRFVESLPWAGDPGVIYCVPSGGSEPDLYDEYYYVNGRFERIPGATIDLTPYATKDWVNGEGYYKKPADGIPGTDLDDALRASIAKAETALQQHQSLAAYRTAQQQDVIDDALANVKEIEVSDTEPTDPNVSLWMYQNPGQKIEIPTMEDFRNLKPATDEQVSAAVGDWLEENISGGETIAVDKSLTVEGAAADAKVVGDLKSTVDEVETTLEMSDSTETVTGDQIVLTNVVVGENVTSISGTANISNGQILPSSMLNASYVTGTTESFEFNKWGFAAVTYSDLNSILKPGKIYHISYDFELVNVVNQNVANKEYGLLISGNILNPPYRSTAENHVNGFKFSVSQNFTVPNNGFSSSQNLNAYNGGNYNEDVCRITNLVISLADETPTWIEADNKTISSGQTIIAPYSTMYVDADNSITLQYIQSAEGNNRLDKIESSIEALNKNLESYKISTNPIIRNVCHRGLSTVAPEDTAPAYVAAKLADFEYVENDLWFTSDGVPVMVHARDLSLVSDGVGNIDEVTYDYFKSLDFGQDDVYNGKYHGLKGLSFAEFITLCKQLGLKVYLDCKSFSPAPTGYNGIEVCADILKKYSYTNNVTWIVGETGVTSVRNTLPDANISYLIGYTPTSVDIGFLSGYILADNPDATRFNLRADLITTAVTESVHDAGLKIDAWLSQIPPTPSVLINTVLKGIDGFTQDGANLDSIMTDYYRDMYSL